MKQKKNKVLNTGITNLGFSNCDVSLEDNTITSIDEYKQMSRDIPPENKKATRKKLENIMNNTDKFNINEHEEIMRIITELLSLMVRFKYQRTFSTDNNILNNIIDKINKTILTYNEKTQSTGNTNATLLTSREIFELAKNTSSNWNIFGKRSIPTNLTKMLQEFGTTTYGNRKPRELFISRALCDWLNSEIGNPTILGGMFYIHVDISNENEIKQLCDLVYGAQINTKDLGASTMAISELQKFMKQQLDVGTEESQRKKIYTIQQVIKIVKQYPKFKSSTPSNREFKKIDDSAYHKIDHDFLKELQSNSKALKIIWQEQVDPALKEEITQFKKLVAGYTLAYNLPKIRTKFHEHLTKKMESDEHKKEYKAHGTILTEHGKKKSHNLYLTRMNMTNGVTIKCYKKVIRE